MEEDVKALINSAAPQQDDVPPASVEPTGDDSVSGTAAEASTGGEDMAFMQELYSLLTSNPELANRVADVIEEFIIGKGGNRSMPREEGTGPTGVMMNPTAAPQTIPTEQLMSLIQALDGRLSNIEKANANMALERELAETKQEYEKLKEHFPILPDLDEKDILQIALQYDGLPLKQALYLWAMQKLQEGEGPVVDRLVAAKIEQSKSNQAPRVESKGGNIPAGTQEPPKNFREARKRAREFLAAISGGPLG